MEPTRGGFLFRLLQRAGFGLVAFLARLAPVEVAVAAVVARPVPPGSGGAAAAAAAAAVARASAAAGRRAADVRVAARVTARTGALDEILAHAAGARAGAGGDARRIGGRRGGRVTRGRRRGGRVCAVAGAAAGRGRRGTRGCVSAAAATTAIFGEFDAARASVDVAPVRVLDAVRGALGICERDESESARAAGVAICDHLDVDDSPEAFERGAETALVGVVAQVAHHEAGARLRTRGEMVTLKIGNNSSRRTRRASRKRARVLARGASATRKPTANRRRTMVAFVRGVLGASRASETTGHAGDGRAAK